MQRKRDTNLVMEFRHFDHSEIYQIKYNSWPGNYFSRPGDVRPEVVAHDPISFKYELKSRWFNALKGYMILYPLMIYDLNNNGRLVAQAWVAPWGYRDCPVPSDADRKRRVDQIINDYTYHLHDGQEIYRDPGFAPMEPWQYPLLWAKGIAEIVEFFRTGRK